MKMEMKSINKMSYFNKIRKSESFFLDFHSNESQYNNEEEK